MTTTDWIIDIALLLVVFRQIRESHIGTTFVLIPLGLVSLTAHRYLHSIPTAGNDLLLIGLLIAIGAALGIGGGLATRVRSDGEHALAKAGGIAVFLWLLGMGSRMAFQIWSEHGGASTLTRFSLAHDITTVQAWVAAFVLMALTEVVVRVGVIVYRAYRLSTARPAVLASAA
jgi:hypothetical protein